MLLEGKGFYIWKIQKCEGGDPNAIARLAKEADLSHVLVKVADEDRNYNYDKDRGIDLVPPVAAALHSEGIQVWGWQYVYGDIPIPEARKAIQRMRELDLDGFVVNAEMQYKEPGKDVAARTYMQELRNALPDFPIALSSFRYPSYHRNFPWVEFLSYCDLNMPQVYWMQAHNPVPQLQSCIREFQAFDPYVPIVPTGAAFSEEGWTATPEDVAAYLPAVQELNLSATNFWEWYDARGSRAPGTWEVVRDYPWPSTPPPRDIIDQYLDALNTQDPAKAASLYDPRAVHLNATRTIQGPQEITAWYSTLHNHVLPNGRFSLTGQSVSDNRRHITWSATSNQGRVLDGSDYIALKDDKIAYHYTYFTVTD
jgi:hypothetical protein